LVEYITDSEVAAYVRTTLTKANGSGAKGDDWKLIIEELDRKAD